jgi:hypothetical protein
MLRLLLCCFSVLLILAIMGCESGNKQDAAKTSDQENAAQAESEEADGKHEYMAVCTDKESHGGNDYVLTKWLGSKYKATVYGKEHERKNKGHVVTYRERLKH